LPNSTSKSINIQRPPGLLSVKDKPIDKSGSNESVYNATTWNYGARIDGELFRGTNKYHNQASAGAVVLLVTFCKDWDENSCGSKNSSTINSSKEIEV